MAPPLVSVLLPVRDAERTVRRAVESILRQTLDSLELIVIDDGSRDATSAAVAAMARRDPRVVQLTTPARGLVPALNLGLERAAGRFIARMDADDEALPLRLQRSVEALEADPSLAGVGTQVEIFADDRPPSPNLMLYGAWLNQLTSAERVERDRFIESPLCHPSVTLRREALARAGGWREGDFAEDYALWLELLAGGARLRAVEPVLFRWRDADARATRQDPRYRPEAMLALKAEYLARHPPVRDQPVVVWGAAKQGLRLARLLKGRGVRVVRLLDVSPRKIGQRIDGWPVVPPQQLGPAGTEHLIACVGAKGAREEIRAFLMARGYEEGAHFTCAA